MSLSSPWTGRNGLGSNCGPGMFDPRSLRSLSRKRFIYRLKGVGREGSAVIAKQCKKDDGTLQHTVYKEILSGLPIST